MKLKIKEPDREHRLSFLFFLHFLGQHVIVSCVLSQAKLEEEQFQLTGSNAYAARFGESIADLGDLDDDGYPGREQTPTDLEVVVFFSGASFGIHNTADITTTRITEYVTVNASARSL